MNKIIFPVFLLVVCGIGLVMLLVVANRKADDILVLREDGTMYVKSAQDAEYVEVTSDETTVKSGTFVKTGSGKGHVLFPNNSLMTLDKNTEIQVTYTAEGIDVMQFIGKTWNRVRNIGSGAYKVNTPTALATVRGTVLGIEVTNITDIYVVEHSVDVQQKNESGQLMEVKVLLEGQLTSVNEFGEKQGFDIQDIPEELKKHEWFLYNKQLDSNFETLDREQIKQKIKSIKVQAIQKKVEFQIKITGDVPIDTTISDKSCTPFQPTADYFDQRIAQMKARGVTQKDLATIQEFRAALEVICRDGTLTEQEAESLKGILNSLGKVPNGSGTVTPTPTATQAVRGINSR